MDEQNDEILKWAYGEVNSVRSASADRIACDPDARKLFMDVVHTRLPDLSESEGLLRLLNLRRRSRLPRLHRGN